MNKNLEFTSVVKASELETIVANATSRRDIFESPDFQAMMSSTLDDLFDQAPHVLSLDVFDTVLLRDDSSELTRFIEIGACMVNVLRGSHSDPMKALNTRRSSEEIDAFLARQMGTKATYRAREKVQGCREGSLDEIHAVSSSILTGTRDFRQKFIECEIDYEASRLTVNWPILQYATRILRDGGKVILLSDMYMSSNDIISLLKKLKVDTSIFDLILSSSDISISKASGRIFSEVERRLELSNKSFVHVGDSLNGDYKRPKENGWQALHLPVSTPELHRRRDDHRKSAEMLLKEFSLSVDVSPP